MIEGFKKLRGNISFGVEKKSEELIISKNVLNHPYGWSVPILIFTMEDGAIGYRVKEISLF